MSIFKIHKLLFLALAISFFSVAKAQSDFRPGFIVNLNGDTIKGLISFRSDKVNAANCIFKKETNQEKVTYLPEQLKSYKFDGGKYFISSISLNYNFKKHIFLEYLIKGTISIYYYQDEIKDHYFVSKDTTIIELDHHDNLTGIAEEDLRILSKTEKYQGQLRFLTQDQPSLFNNLEKIDCVKKDLIFLTKEYQKLSCPSQECIHYEKRTGGRLKLKFGILSSAGISHLSSPPYDMYTSDYEETKCLDFNPAFTYGIGALLNMYLDYNGRNKFSIQLSPVVNFVEYKSNEERPLSPLLYVYKLNIKYSTLKIPLLFKYSLYSSNQSLFPFVKIGPGWMIYLNQKGTYEYYSVPLSGSESHTEVYRKPLNKVTKPTEIYFTAGAGTDIRFGNNLFSIGATYSFGNGKLKGFRSDVQLQIEFQFQ